jgi:hypothetical protein
MPVAFPATISPIDVDARPRHGLVIFENPIDLSQEVQGLSALRWEVDITMQLMNATQAADFGAFLQDLEGGAETFSFNLTPWAPGWDPAPGTRNFRLVDPATGWRSRLQAEFNFRFSAIEDV